MEYPDPNSFDGFSGGVANEEMMEEIQNVLKSHGYGGQFLIVTTDSQSFEIHAPMKPQVFQMAAHHVADAALQIE
jgi:hypothetical protein